MKVDVENLVSISEANQNFSRVVKKVDTDGPLIILKNNKPRYLLASFQQLEQENNCQDEVFQITKDLLQNVQTAYLEQKKKNS